MNKTKKQLLALSIMAVLALPNGAILARSGDDSGGSSSSGSSSGSTSGSTGSVDLRGNGTVEDNSAGNNTVSGVMLRGDGTVDDNSTGNSTSAETLRGDGTVDDNPGIRQNRGVVQTSASGTVKFRGDGSIDDNSGLRRRRGTDDLAGSATGTKLRGDGSVDDNSNSSDDGVRDRGEEHRSVVASFVQNLIRVASNDKSGIGEQVREIANEQNNSKDLVEKSIGEIERRGKFKTFFIGTDFKNIGQIRSEITKTDDRLTRLNGILSSASTSTASSVKIEIEKLQTEQEKLKDFLTTNEDKFSLFGWLARMLNK